MKFSNGIILAALSGSALGTNLPRDAADGLDAAGQPQAGTWACGLSQDNLDDLIDGYTLLLTTPGSATFNATASRILHTNLTVYSDSLNIITNKPLGGASFAAGRDAFVAAQSTTPALAGLTTTDVFLGGYWNASYSPQGDGATKGGNGWWSGNSGVFCTDLKASWRWTAGAGPIGVAPGAVAAGAATNGTLPVQGFVDFVLAQGDVAAGQNQVVIQTVYAEFNTAAFLRNQGVAGCVSPSAAAALPSTSA